MSKFRKIWCTRRRTQAPKTTVFPPLPCLIETRLICVVLHAIDLSQNDIKRKFEMLHEICFTLEKIQANQISGSINFLHLT